MYVHILTHMYFAASLLSDYVNAAVIVWHISLMLLLLTCFVEHSREQLRCSGP